MKWGSSRGSIPKNWEYEFGLIAWNWESTVWGLGMGTNIMTYPWIPGAELTEISSNPGDLKFGFEEKLQATPHTWWDKKNLVFLQFFPWTNPVSFWEVTLNEQLGYSRLAQTDTWTTMNNKFLRIQHHWQGPVSPKVFMLDQHSLSIYKVTRGPWRGPIKAIDANGGYGVHLQRLNICETEPWNLSILWSYRLRVSCDIYGYMIRW